MTDTDDETTLELTVTPSELKAVQAMAAWWQEVCRANGVEVEPDISALLLSRAVYGLHGYWSRRPSRTPWRHADEQPVKH